MVSYKESWSSISNEGARQYYYPHDAKKELISSCMDAPAINQLPLDKRKIFTVLQKELFTDV